MAEGEGRTDGGEDLFEDLDKFFAPIQDVDWPETKEPARRAPPSDPAEPGPEGEGEPGAEPEPTGPTPGQEDLFEEPAEPPITVRSPSGDDAEEDDGVTSFLFESEAEEELEDRGAISEEAFTQPPNAYVDLPGPEGTEEESAVAELIEEGRPGVDEPAPDLDAVEAAADHFAESVREEVEVEPGSGSVQPDTEEVQIAALLGDEEDLQEVGEPEPPRT
ncbi:MAG: hypothetical protein ACRDHU_13865, partial [Actinomycetota bacterium]